MLTHHEYVRGAQAVQAPQVHTDPGVKRPPGARFSHQRHTVGSDYENAPSAGC